MVAVVWLLNPVAPLRTLMGAEFSVLWCSRPVPSPALLTEDLMPACMLQSVQQAALVPGAPLVGQVPRQKEWLWP